CDVLLIPLFGRMHCDITNKVGSVCLFSCEFGFHLVGNASIKCNSNLLWNASVPMCYRTTCKPIHADPVNGGVFCFNENNVGSQCVFSCEDGYRVLGSATSTCNTNLHGGTDGVWTSPTPRCIRKLTLFLAKRCYPVVRTVRYGRVSCTNWNKFGSVCSVTCNRGYFVEGRRQVTCSSNFFWNNAPPRCIRITCSPRYTDLYQGGIFCYNANNLGSECIFECELGFYMVGSPRVTCGLSTIDDEIGEWSNPAPTCEAIRCQPPVTELLNGDVTCTDRNMVGSVCVFYCDPGFSITGEIATTCEHVSSVTAEWTSRGQNCQRQECMPVGSIRNGEVGCTDGDSTGSECSFTCNAVDGYKLTTGNDSSNICLNNMNWDAERPCCAPITCQPRPLQPENGRVQCSDRNAVGSVCFYTCNAGYDRVGEPAVTCNDVSGSGQWSASPPTCQLQQCQPLSPPANGQINCTNGNELGSLCQFTCDPNYMLTGDPISECVTGANGSPVFDNPPPICERKIIIVLNHGNITTLQLNGTVVCTKPSLFVTVCSFECISTFELIGNVDLTCVGSQNGDGSGSWSSNPPICSPMECTLPPDPVNGSKVCNGGTFLGAYCEFSCDPGFSLVGDTGSDCSETPDGNLAFNNPPPVCEPISCQPVYNTLDNGGVSCTNSNMINSQCTFTCNPAYELVGQTVLTCNDVFNGDLNGQWSSEAPFCRTISCQPVYNTLDNGGVSCTNSNMINSQCTFTCNPAYELVGQTVLTCNDDFDGDLNGQWSSEAPFCRRMECTLPPDPANGSKVCNGGTFLGAHCEFSCDPGFSLVGSSGSDCSITPDGPLAFTNPPPVCEPISCQPVYNTLDNGGVSCTNSNMINSQCTFTCNPAYELVGQMVLTCNDDFDGDLNGQWSSEAPFCRPISCQPVYNTLENGGASCTNSNMINSQCTFTCNPAYELVGQMVLTCNDDFDGDLNGQWSSEAPFCRPISCQPVYNTLDNGGVSCTNSNMINSQCTFTCNPAYELVGQTVLTCNDDFDGDLNGQWSSEAPFCRRMECTLPPDPANGSKVCNGGTFLGAHCEFSCDPGFSLVGATGSDCSITPDGNLAFTNPPPVCEPISCQPVYNTLDNGGVSCTNSNMINSQCTFTCNPAYELVGQTVLTCNDDFDGDLNGQWSSEAPFCRRMECTLPPDPANGSKVCNGGTFLGAHCEFSCNPGFSLVGATGSDCSETPDGNLAFTNPPPVCERMECTLPPDPVNGSKVCNGGTFLGAHCEFSCNPGFSLVGATGSDCSETPDGNLAFTNPPPVCEPISCQPVYNTLENGGVSCTNSNMINSQCTFTCNPAYELVGQMVLTCNDDFDGDLNGQWSSEAPFCRRMECTLPPDPVNGSKVCNGGTFLGAHCEFSCDPGFSLVGATGSDCSETPDGNLAFTNPPPVCEPISCQPVYNTLENGGVSCTNSNMINSQCTFTCNPAYELVGQTVLTCNDDFDGDLNGQWSSEAPFCRSTFLGAHCEFSCDPGFSLVGATGSDCSITPDGPLAFNNPPPVCEPISCQPVYNELNNGSVSCTNSNMINSQCTFTCNPAYELVGQMVLTCNDDFDGDLNGQWSSEAPFCRPISCQPVYNTLENGGVSCTNSNMINSQCTFTCNPAYELVGQMVLTCNDDFDGDLNGQWSSEAPFCRPISCQPVYNTMEHGGVSCTNSNMINSQCTFTCNPGYELVGQMVLTCNDDFDGDLNGQWSSEAPYCQREDVLSDEPCPPIGTIPNSELTCSDGTSQDSVCNLACDQTNGYFVYPPGSNQFTCQPSGVWNIPPPCCARDCLGHAVVDLVFILDSSTSIGSPNWETMKSFVKDIISSFDISADQTRVSVFRYNRRVDRRSQILLNHYLNDKPGLLSAVEQIPYSGSGTYIGRALQYARDHVLRYRNGDRHVKDVIVTLTDGRSYDDVLPVSNQLRQFGATVNI
uniref:Uncharacterized protein n=1 Tax=Ciona savignyi TaxID=51511 RepID=H2Z6L8_CIOSA